MNFISQVVVVVASLFFAASFVVPKGIGAGVYSLLLCGLIAIALRLKPENESFGKVLRTYWPVHLSMSGLMAATLIRQIAVGSASSREFELPLQLAFFPVFFWVFLLVRDRHLQRISFGIAAGAIVGFVALCIESNWGVLRPTLVCNIPLIPFANIVLLLGMLSLLSLGSESAQGKLTVLIKAVAGLSGLYASYLSQARGAWVSLPLFLIIALLVLKNIHIRHKAGLFAIAVAVLAGSFVISDTIRDRVSAAQSDVRQFADGTNKDTSVGHRLQLWQAGWALFAQNPAVGIGRDHYAEAVQKLAEQKALTRAAATQPHPHNDVIFQMVSLGIFGLLAIISLYFVPAYYFLRNINSADTGVRSIAGMGLALACGFFIFGLSDAMFYWRSSYAFYVILLSLIFASLHKKKSLKIGSGASAKPIDNAMACSPLAT